MDDDATGLIETSVRVSRKEGNRMSIGNASKKQRSTNGWTKKILVTILPAMLLVSGCAGGSSQVVAPPVTTASTRLIIYRPSASLFSFVNSTVKINGIDSCKIGNGIAFQTDVPAGVVNLSASDYVTGVLGTSKFSFTASAGQVYYVRFSIDKAEAYASIGGNLAGEALEQMFAKDSGPFAIALTDQAGMGGMKPVICTPSPPPIKNAS